MTILIAGAGIGGLTAALSLHAVGVDAVVVESTREIRPLGVGINLLPHAVRELTELGVGEDLAAVGTAIDEMVYCDRFGKECFTEQRGVARGYSWPQYATHRGELQLLLLAKVRERLGADAVRAGARLVGLEEAGTTVRARLLDRATGAVETVEAEALIGADGLHSTVRAQLHPDGGPLLWSGIRMWRGVTVAEPFRAGHSLLVARHGDTDLTAYPIGRNRINWVCRAKVAEPQLLQDGADWNRTGRPADVLRHYEGWDLGWPNVPDLLAGARQILEYPMVDRDPLPVWGSGRVTLLGDAAHPMYPTGANGASQSIVDARVLACELQDAQDIPAGLEAYQSKRREETTAVVLANRTMFQAGRERASQERVSQAYRHATDSDLKMV